MGLYTRNIIVSGTFKSPVRICPERTSGWSLELYTGSKPIWASDVIKRAVVAHLGHTSILNDTSTWNPTGTLLVKIDNLPMERTSKGYALIEPAQAEVINTGTAGYYILYHYGEKFFVGTVGFSGCDLNLPSSLTDGMFLNISHITLNM